jgi:uncharacterized membrane protein
MSTVMEPGARLGAVEIETSDWSADSRARMAPLAPRARGEDERRGDGADGLATFLGWFSVGLGVAQLAAPRAVARFIGVNPSDRTAAVMRAIGVRELAAGAGILSQPRPAGWLWARVAGDIMDLALLGRALDERCDDRDRTVTATLAVLGVAALDAMAGKKETAAKHRDERMGESGAGPEPVPQGICVQKSVTVGRPVQEVYDFWRDFTNLPRFMRHLESVTELGGNRSHWVAKAPAGAAVEWDAELVEDRRNELISWRSLENADVESSGVVRFREAPGGRGTEVRVEMRYDPPGGRAGALFAKLFREEPGQQVSDDLRAFKQVMEVGEVVLSDATYDRGMHPAQPPAGL